MLSRVLIGRRYVVKVASRNVTPMLLNRSLYARCSTVPTFIPHHFARTFAKGANRGHKEAKKPKKNKNKKKSSGPAEVAMDLDDYDVNMGLAYEQMEEALHKIRIAQADPAILDDVEVPAYGKMVALKTIAAVSAKTTTKLSITVHDSALNDAVMKVLHTSSLNLTPVQDGKSIIVQFVKASKENREALLKEVKTRAEKTRQEIRGIRQKALNAMKKESLTKDEEQEVKEALQDLTNDHIADVNERAEEKSAQLEGK